MKYCTRGKKKKRTFRITKKNRLEEGKQLTVPHQGPAAHQVIPSHTPPLCCIEHRAPWMAWMHCEFDPAPISPRNPLRLLALSHAVADARRSAPIVEETQVPDVPEESESRYWCIWIATLLLGSWIAPKTFELPELVHDHAPVQAFEKKKKSTCGREQGV